MHTSAAASGSNKDHNYYEVLGVSFDASEADIRRRYHNVVKTLHPDRRRPGTGGAEALERFHQVQSAWRCLSDPTRRLLYDLRNYGKSSLHDDSSSANNAGVQAKLLDMQKDQAMRDMSNMDDIHERTLRREQAARGILIRTALYGDLRLREDSIEECMAGKRTVAPEDLVGPFIEVSKPVQCLVEQHTIVLQGGAGASKADLPGFYNPLPLDVDAELCLYVAYEFRGHMHEVIVGDRETLSLPYRRHAVPPGKALRGPFSPANVTRREACGARTPQNKGTGLPPKRISSVGLDQSQAAAALKNAMVAYRLRGLCARGADEASPREFLVAASALGFLLTAMSWWLLGNSERRGR